MKLRVAVESGRLDTPEGHAHGEHADADAGTHDAAAEDHDSDGDFRALLSSLHSENP
jgi:hypothetical protein